MPSELSIAEALVALEGAGVGILLLCDGDDRLQGTLTDGDIRRAILRGASFEEPCRTIANAAPLVGQAPLTDAEALHQMDHGKHFVIDHLPVLDDQGRVVDLILRSDVSLLAELPLSAVIMAGGAGSRLRPLTDDTPKPLLPVGDRPLMEHILEQLRQAGIRQVNVTTHYLSEKIVKHFGDGRAFGVDLTYVTEDRPLGTAGSLSLLSAATGPLLVINGDILTRVDFRAMLAFHREHAADLTVAVRRYAFQVPYGVLECEGPYVRAVREKPEFSVLTNAGIYLLEPAIHALIPSGTRFDMTDLIQQLLDNGRSVVSFPVVEYWMDIGQHADYDQAQADVKSGRLAH